MAKQPHRRTLTPPMTQWERVLEESDEADRGQAGEIEPGRERGGGGDKGIDADTGDGGYGGDAALSGVDDADAQPDRPLDREVESIPRAAAGDGDPVDAGSLDEHEGSLRRESLDTEGDRDSERT